MGRLRADLAEIVQEQVQFRELLLRMTVRDIQVRYKQAAMGFGWAVFMPLMNTLVFSIIFTRVAPIDTGTPYALFSYTGLLFWNFFASSLRFAVTSLSGNASLVTKIYFPREIFPFSAILVCLVDLFVGCTLLAGLMIYYRVPVTSAIVALPVLLAVQIMFTAGIALIVSMANLFMRDVKYIFEMVLTVWMFATSVVYPIGLVGGKLGATLQVVNPMTPIIDGYRAVLLYGQWPAWSSLGATAVLAAVTLFVGWLTFHRAEFRFAESV